jgi:outer membrane protein OmpA-like peptidoglycan-associated protein
MRRGLVGALVASAALIAVPALAQEYHYVKVAEIYLPCAPGHGDWVSYDPSNEMVYVSMKDDGMAVIDTRTNSVAHVIKPIEEPNVMAFDSNYIYETAAEGLPQGMSGANNGTGFGTKNQIVVIDKHTWQIVDRVETWGHGTTPDGIGVANGRLYVAMDDNSVMNVYTATAHPQFVAQWNLYPYNTNHWWLNTTDFTGPDAFSFNADGSKIYEAMDQYEEIINAQTGAIEVHAKYPIKLTGKGGTKGSITDPKTGYLWIATSTANPGVRVVNASTLQTIKTIPQPAGSDQLAFDPGLRMFYTFGGKGFGAYNADTMTRVAAVNTGVPVTHTGDVDTATHAVYVYEGKRAAVGVFMPVAGPGPNGMWEVSAAAPMAPMGASNYTVYFAFNSATLTPDARKIVGEAAMSAKHGSAQLVVDGYTDLSGTAQYNMGLSMRRADAVRAALVADGISPRRISVHAFGKTHPAVPTPDGVREPRNRRAVVVVGPAMS